MNPKRRLRGITALLCAMFLCTSIPVHAEEEQIKISDKEYAVTLKDAVNVFIGNEKPVSGEIGSKVFLTYTVEKVTKNTVTQSGFIGTMDNTIPFPYTDEKGRLYVDGEENGSRLYEEGCTYVFRFERTEAGFEYQAVKLKGEEVTPIKFAGSTQTPEVENYKYYGTWIGGATQDNIVSATLNHVRCYDENGNDLGVAMNASSASRLDKVNEMFNVHPVIDSTYSFSFDDTDTAVISNRYPAKTDVVYMEYEVENVKKDDTTQQGLIASSAPTAAYPHADNKGYLLLKIYDKAEDKPMLKEGGKYFIRFEKKEDAFDCIVQRTVNGKTEIFSFPSEYGSYSPYYQYFSIWFGDGKDHSVTADFKNVKCYDADGNSLGIQLNKKDVPLSHKGGNEDYSTSEAVYYCKENNCLINLQDEQQFSMEADGIVTKGTYSIQGDTDLYLLTEEGKEHYIYAYLQLEDEEGNVYKRMKNSKVKFVTGDETFEEIAEAKNGYRVTEPEKPTKEGNTFKGWYLSDKTAFNFDTVVTESITLYAMWEDGNGNEYLAVDAEAKGIDTALYVSIAASAVIAIGSVAGCIVMVRRRRHGSI